MSAVYFLRPPVHMHILQKMHMCSTCLTLAPNALQKQVTHMKFCPLQACTIYKTRWNWLQIQT